MKGKSKLIILALTIAFLFVGCTNIFRLADLRKGHDIESASSAKAQQLLSEMGAAHGIENWKSVKAYEAIFEDDFFGFLGKQGNPFKDHNLQFSMHYVPVDQTGRLEITKGTDQGLVWGIQDGHAYTLDDTNRAIPSDKKDIKFWLPTYQYFIELPNRIQEANTLSYAGTKTIANKTCDGVLASWNTVEPQKDIDQYLVWIDKATKRIVKVEYTIRDIYAFVTGAATFLDYKDYNGILLPSKMPVESNLLKEGYLHEMRIVDFKTISLDKHLLYPLSLN